VPDDRTLYKIQVFETILYVKLASKAARFEVDFANMINTGNL